MQSVGTPLVPDRDFAPSPSDGKITCLPTPPSQILPLILDDVFMAPA